MVPSSSAHRRFLLLVVICASASPQCHARHWTDIVSPMLYQFPGLDEYRVTKIAERDPFDFSTIEFAPTTYPTRPQAPTASPTLSVPPTSAPVDHWANSVENGTCPFGQVLYEVHLLDSSGVDSDASVTISISRVIKPEDDYGVLQTNRSADNSTTTYTEIVDIKQPTREIVFSGEVGKGFEGFQYVCLEPEQCYTADVEGGGSGQHEAQWEIFQALIEIPQEQQDAFVPLATALAPTTCEFSVPNEENGVHVCAVTCGSTVVTDAVPLQTTTTKQEVEINEPSGPTTILKKNELNLEVVSIFPSDAPSFMPSAEKTTSPTSDTNTNVTSTHPATTSSSIDGAASGKIVAGGAVSTEEKKTPPAATGASTLSESGVANPFTPSGANPLEANSTIASSGMASSESSIGYGKLGSATSAVWEQSMSPSPVIASMPAPTRTASSASIEDAASNVAPGRTDSLQAIENGTLTDAPSEFTFAPTDTASSELTMTFAPSGNPAPEPAVSLAAVPTSLPTISSGNFDTPTMSPSPISTLFPTDSSSTTPDPNDAATMSATFPSSATRIPNDSSGTIPSSTSNPPAKPSISQPLPDAGNASPNPNVNSAPDSTDALPASSSEQSKQLLDENKSKDSVNNTTTKAANTTKPVLASSPSIPKTGNGTSPATAASRPESSAGKNTSMASSPDVGIESSSGTSPSNGTKIPQYNSSNFAVEVVVMIDPPKSSNGKIPSNNTDNRSTQPPRKPLPEPSSTANVTPSTALQPPPTTGAWNQTRPTNATGNQTRPANVAWNQTRPTNMAWNQTRPTNAAWNQTRPSTVTDNQSTQAARKPLPASISATNVTTSDNIQFPSANTASNGTVPVTINDNPSTATARRPPPQTNSTPASSGFAYIPANMDATAANQSTAPPRRPPPTNSTPSASIENVSTDDSATANQSTTAPARRPIPPTNSTTSAGVEYQYIPSDKSATANQSTALPRRPPPPMNYSAPAGLAYVPTDGGTAANQSTAPQWRPMIPMNSTTSAGLEYVSTDEGATANQSTTPPSRRPMPPASSTTSVSTSTSAGSSWVSNGVIPSNSTLPKYATNTGASTAPFYPISNKTNATAPAFANVNVYNQPNAATSDRSSHMDGQPLTTPAADGNDFAVEVVVMLDPPESLPQTSTQIQPGTRPQVSTESSFSTLKLASPTLSGNSTYDSGNTSIPLSEHTTTSASTTNSYPTTGASQADYNQAAMSMTSNFTNSSRLESASGNVANPVESTHLVPALDVANLTASASGPMYIRTGASSGPPEGAGGANTNSVDTWTTDSVQMGSNSRGNVRGKQQEQYQSDAIPYYETTKKNEDKRKTNNKSMRRRRG